MVERTYKDLENETYIISGIVKEIIENGKVKKSREELISK